MGIVETIREKMMRLKIEISKSAKKRTVITLMLIFICIVGLSPKISAQQNIQFTQYVFNTLSVNPAYAGYKEDWYAQAAQRIQWQGIEGSPTTTSVSMDGVTDEFTKRIGLGLQLTADRFGAESNTSLYANYAYRIRMNREDTKRLCFGLALGVTQYGLDGTLLEPVDVDDPLLNYEKKFNYIPDARFGVYYYTPKWFLGFSATDMFSGYDTSNSIFNWNTDSILNIVRRPHYYLISGALINLSSYTRMRPSCMIREDFKGPTNLDLSVSFIFDDRFWVGATYRTPLRFGSKEYEEDNSLSLNNAVAGILQFQITENLRIGYSYDLALNSLFNSQNGTHELTVGWLLPQKRKRVLSPRFF